MLLARDWATIAVRVALCFCVSAAGVAGTQLCTHPARMAKLVDAPGLGPDASNGVGVRVPLLAPQNFYYLDDFHGNCSRNFR